MVGYVVTGLAVLLCTISYRRAVQKAASIQIEEQQMLAGEAEHRVKNVLSLVQAIAHQSFAKADEKSMQKFVGRLKALSDAQGVLTRGRTAADLADVVRTAVAPFRAGNNFVITGPMTTIDAQQAVSLALLLHELCTNATKYGALSVPGGKVTIRWDVTDGHYELCWEESGGPIVQPPARKGFGTRLLSKSNMHATVDYAPTGVVCRIKQSRKAR
jgi:two-component sensor histidine kinase